MSYLLDTCVVSEFARPAPDQRVLQWVGAQAEEELFVSSVVLGELAKGIARLEDGPRRRRLAAWLHSDLRARFGDRVLGVSAEVALKWGELTGEAIRRGVAIGMADGLIGATGIVHSMTVVTRNVQDLEATGAVVYSPWEA
ncbi:MAG: type II toxin-antitoxin system VapC family toxin [Candidatus Latescibacterota bacterium]